MKIRNSGFSIDENVLTDQECNGLIESLALNCGARGRAGVRHLMNHPAVSAVAKDLRLLRIAQRTLGEAAAPFRATLFAKSERANWLVTWHQDTALPLTSFIDSHEWGPWSTKAGILYAHAPAWVLCRVLALRVYLDASQIENGPLRVIPGSHRSGVLTDAEVLGIARRRRFANCLVSRGGVLAMRPLLIHSSAKLRCNAPRRVLHIEYASAIELGSGARLAIA